MKSISLFTHEMDDLETGVADLVKQMENFELQKNTMAIVFAHPDTEFEEFLPLIKEHWDFPVIGCTALSAITPLAGYVTQGITAIVITADDVTFTVGCTGEMNSENYVEEMESLYKRLAAQNTEKEKLVMTYLSPLHDVVGDAFVDIISKQSNDAPIYGGMASDEFVFDDCRVFYDENVLQFGCVLVLVHGNVRPVVEHEFSIYHEATFSALITESDGSTIYSIDGRPFIEAINDVGIIIDENTAFNDCIGTPFMVTYNTPEGDELVALRSLVSIDIEKGSATFKGNMPQGAMLNICLITNKDISASVEKVIKTAFEDIKAPMAEGYKYTTLLVTSCASRVMTFSKFVQNEVDKYLCKVPDGMGLAGMYSFGEIAHTFGNKTGKRYNMFYNTAFALLVM